MPGKHLLYFTSQNVAAYTWKRGELTLERVFAANDDGAAAFGDYMSMRRNELHYLLADLVEEDFSVENLPAVRGKDRRALVQRKIAQRYRDTTLSLAMSLGVEKTGGRPEERVLFSSFTNTLQFQPWLAVLRSREARLVGVYSAPWLAPLIGDRLQRKRATYLLVSPSQAGLRQTYVENGNIRFSRLGRVDAADARLLAQSAALESARIQQYLVNTRVLGREAPALDVVVLAPGSARAEFEKACRPTANLRFQVVDLEAFGRSSGLKSAPEGSAAEALYLHLLAVQQPALQFAGDDARRFYRLWRARVTLVSAGLAVFAFCALLSALRLVDVYNVNQAATLDRQQAAFATQQYARMQETFPKTPAPNDALRAIVHNYRGLLAQTASPEATIVQISRALASSPQIELERIEWNLVPGTARPDAGAPAAKGTKPAAAPAGSSSSLQSVRISGRINAGQNVDYRSITRIVDQFLEELRRQPGIEVVSRRLPFDIAAEKSLSGDIGTRQAADVPRFSIVLNKRTGP